MFFQKSNVFINRCPAQIANSCQFGNLQLPVFESGIVAEEDCGDAVLGCLRTAYLLALGLGVRHTRPHTLPYHRQLQLTEYTPAICKKASLIGSALPSRQSSVILPIITRRRRFSRTWSMISHSCWVLRASRGTSNVRMVSPACACANIASCWLLILLSPCSYSRKRVSAPAVFSSRTCLLIVLVCQHSHVRTQIIDCLNLFSGFW